MLSSWILLINTKSQLGYSTFGCKTMITQNMFSEIENIVLKHYTTDGKTIITEINETALSQNWLV